MYGLRATVLEGRATMPGMQGQGYRGDQGVRVVKVKELSF